MTAIPIPFIRDRRDAAAIGQARTIIALLFCALAFAGLVAGAGAAQANDREPQLDLPRLIVTLETAGGPVVFDSQLAETPQTRAKGLMFRRSMPAREGMLFDFQQAQRVSFWMDNTPLPLDLIFIGDDGVVRTIARDAVPYSRATIPSKVAVRWVLEVNAGIADEIGLKPGDRVIIPSY